VAAKPNTVFDTVSVLSRNKRGHTHWNLMAGWLAGWCFNGEVCLFVCLWRLLPGVLWLFGLASGPIHGGCFRVWEC
jgi:hypothetical protein